MQRKDDEKGYEFAINVQDEPVTQCRSIRMVSTNQVDKINFLKDDMSKESLDNILLTLETYPSVDVQRVLLDLWPIFQDEHERYSLGNLTQKDPVCQFLRKLDGKPTIGP